MDIQQLRCFVAVADELHFGRAAERLHVTASPLSRRIRELEHELGSDLFVREYHRVRLTVFGLDFLEPARGVLERFDALKHLSQDPEAYRRRRCRLGVAPLAAPLVVDAVLDAFHKTAPDVELPLTPAPSAELLADLAGEGLDLAVVHLPIGVPDLNTLTVGRGPYAVAMRADDEFAGCDSLALSELRHREFLMASPKVHPFFMGGIRAAMLAAGITRIIDLPHTDVIQMATQVSRTGALNLTPGGPNHPAARVFRSPDYRLVPLSAPRITVSIGVAWRPGSEDQVPGLDDVLTALRDEYGANPISL